MKVHVLKTWPDYFAAVADGSKTFEVRKNDRDFQVGDTLILREFADVAQAFTGRAVERVVTYVLPGDQFGLAAGFAVLGLRDPLAVDLSQFVASLRGVLTAIRTLDGLGAALEEAYRLVSLAEAGR